MALKPETLFRKHFVKRLEALPNTAIFSIQQVAIRGTPDLLLCVNGDFVAIELKKSQKAATSKLQLWNIDRIKGAKGMAFIVSPENEDKVIDQLKWRALGVPKQ